MRSNDLYRQIREILIKADPIGIYFADMANVDEYDPELVAIMERLPSCQTEEQVLEMVWGVFKSFFGDLTVGSRERYRWIAKQIWALISTGKAENLPPGIT